MSVFEDSAIAYARDEGLHVFPLLPHGKTPLTPHGLEDATTDILTIETWWSRWPNANVAIRTGPVVVVDEDREGALAALAAQHGQQLPDTRVCRTGTGRHYYFTQPNGARIRNTAGKLAPGIDTRGDGGYVVAPPSIHPNGGAYQWESTRDPVPLPAWIVQLLEKKEQRTPLAAVPTHAGTSPYGQRALEAETTAVATSPEGIRNNRLNIAAFSLAQLAAGGELDEGDALEGLYAAARACGLPEHEAQATIKSGFESGFLQPRRAPERPTLITTRPAVPRAEPETVDQGFRLNVEAAASLCAEPDSDTDQLLGPLVLAGGRTILVGDTGHGKTTLGFQLIHTILSGETFLDWQGKGEGRALIIDLEQGRKSVKRGLRGAGLHDRPDVDLVLVPDGLSLDRDPHHLQELERVLQDGQYTIVDLDPYYKAHRAEEPNAERPIVDLMRTLDSLRTQHNFALILPAHPRKDAVGGNAIRRLTIHDIAGSGAITRGAEIILAIERVAHGYARLRYLKDREGDLPVDEAWHLVYNKQSGFQRDPKDLAPARDYQAELLNISADGDWRTIRDYMEALKAGDKTIRPILNSLVADGIFEYAEGPQGRHRNAKCWRLTAASDSQMHLNAVDADPASSADKLTTASSAPPRKGADVDAVVVVPTASHEAHPEDTHTAAGVDDLPFLDPEPDSQP